ncbi:HNH endonuclease [Phenylobacterium sp. VNQ135]|uniref:HNH endonuclease n=1 Tax=Phenylobacterium sp. VNQ135 TaxID=3400922 RepID=UPI003C0D3955
MARATIQIGTRRAVAEWIADHPDQAIPDRIKARIFDRYDGKCALTGRKLQIGEYDFDHIKRLRDGGEHRESNLHPVWRPKHREKTAEENKAGAKAERMRRKHLGLWKGSGRKLKSRNTFKDRRPA